MLALFYCSIRYAFVINMLKLRMRSYGYFKELLNNHNFRKKEELAIETNKQC